MKKTVRGAFRVKDGQVNAEYINSPLMYRDDGWGGWRKHTGKDYGEGVWVLLEEVVEVDLDE